MDGTGTSLGERDRLLALEAEILEFCGHLNAATHRWLLLLAEFDVVRGWAGAGTRSCAHWLHWKCGLDVGAAREKLRVAHALRGLPAISAAMATGELSYSKVRALTRVANAATEDLLLEVARHGTAEHVERLVRQYRRVREVENVARDARQQRARGVHWQVDEDGSYVFRLQLPAEAGARFLAALDAAVESLPPPGVSAETHAPGVPSAQRPEQASWSVKRADAAALMAESFLAHGAAELPGGERQTLVVHVEAESFAAHRQTQAREVTPVTVSPAASRERSAAAPDVSRAPDVSAETCAAGEPLACCGLEHGPALPLETARRLGCDASVIRLVVDAEGAPLEVGRRTRTIPPALKRALTARDGGCRYPGCTNLRFVDGHHVRHWAEGGETTLSNLVLLCRFHHRLVHEGRASVVMLDDGALRFMAPDGRVAEARRFDVAAQSASARAESGLDVSAETSAAARADSPPESPADSPPDSSVHDLAIVRQHRARGLVIDAGTAATRWAGEPMDYGMAIDGLLWRDRQAQAKSAAGPGCASP